MVRRASGAVGLLFATTGVLASLATSAVAAPIVDADRTGAATVAARLAEVDTTLRVAEALLPAAVADADAAVAALDRARAAERNALAAHPITPDAEGSQPGAVADVAADAILDDLAPERATAERQLAEQAVTDRATRRDFLLVTIAAARDERFGLLATLEATGQARTRWSVALLDALGAPVTVENLRALSAWIGAEGNTVRANNPLATTMGAAGAVDLNDHGVKGYPNDAVGIDATVRTLRNGSYEPILDALFAGDSAERVVRAVAASPWGTGENAVKRLALDS